MPTGIIIIDKPQDWTSMDVCGKLRRLYGEKRVGHAGTLDPMATGVLPVFVGRATRAVEFAETGEKEYLAGLKLGLSTDTQDTTGQVLAERPVTCSRGDIEAVLDRFRGEIEQIPPMYSALKVNGQKLYQLARKGKTVERKPRSITIYQLELGEEIEENEYALRVKCSKGTYIRTLCQDIGDALGCGGCMSSLRRTMAAGFDLSQAVTMDRVIAAAENGTAEPLLLPVDRYFCRYPAISITGDSERRCRNGNDFRSKGE
ncbi:MAG: tRNA pseudouridine(55) synthase TruB, partial [Oscillospiraceae bacterium]|nr:tRNA pseudouridine(55) synthase TruB [Oscillospiraceae bacterium]